MAEEAKATADSSRLIPPYNAAATRPDDVYRLHDIIPEAELNALSISKLRSAQQGRERIMCLPYTRSNWVNQHLTLFFAAPKPNKTLVYVHGFILFWVLDVDGVGFVWVGAVVGRS